MFYKGFLELSPISRIFPLAVSTSKSTSIVIVPYLLVFVQLVPSQEEKHSFCLASVTYLGHVIDASGTIPDQLKVKAIFECLFSKDVKQYFSFFGIAKNYGKFVPNILFVALLLYKLTKNTLRIFKSSSADGIRIISKVFGVRYTTNII